MIICSEINILPMIMKCAANMSTILKCRTYDTVVYISKCNLISCKANAKRKRITTETLTHLSLASLLWDIGKQHSPRCDAAERGVTSGAILFAYRIFIEKFNKI